MSFALSRNKTKSYNFREFMRDEHASDVKPPTLSLMPLALAPFVPIKALAATTEASMQAKMMTAFAPIIDLIQSLAYPVALVVVLGGGLAVMIGNTEKGFSLIQRAGLGYVLVMMLPMLLDVLVSAMGTVV